MAIQHRPSSFGPAFMILLALAATSVTAASDKPPGSDGNASFPEVRDSWSPDGRFVLKNVDDREDPKSPHAIFLTDMRTGTRTLLYSYPRKAEVLWSPASNALAINDWDANDEAQSIVIRLVPRRERIDLREEFMKSRRPDREKKLATDRGDYNHNYAHISRWVDANTVLLIIEGRNSSAKRRFRLEYAYGIGDSFRLLKRTVR